MYDRELYKRGEYDLIEQVLKKTGEVSTQYLEDADKRIDEEIESMAQEAETDPYYWKGGEAMAYFCLCEERGIGAADEWLRMFREMKTA